MFKLAVYPTIKYLKGKSAYPKYEEGADERKKKTQKAHCYFYKTCFSKDYTTAQSWLWYTYRTWVTLYHCSVWNTNNQLEKHKHFNIESFEIHLQVFMQAATLTTFLLCLPFI